jgi:hypothetical protein
MSACAASRPPFAAGGNARQGMPAAIARSSAGAFFLLEATKTIRASRRRSAIASMSAWRFEPRPLTQTAMGSVIRRGQRSRS